MTAKEKVKNDIMLRMQYHLDANAMAILGNVLVQVLSDVEIVEMETLPASVDDTNKYIIELFKMQKAPKLSEKTVAYYLDTIYKLIINTGKPLTKINRMDIERYLLSLQNTNNATSLNNQRRNISAFFTWMRKSHIVLENPCEAIDSYKEINKPIDHLEPEDFEQLKGGCLYKRDRAMIEFLRSTALRVGEVENVKVSDIDWRTGQIMVYGKKNRTYRPVYLDSVALKYLKDYIDERNIQLNSTQSLFTSVKGEQGVALSTTGIRSAIWSIQKRADMSRRIYPHLFRKSTGTNIVRRGGSVHDAGEYLGHKDRSTAGQHYVFIDNGHTQEIFRRFVATV